MTKAPAHTPAEPKPRPEAVEADAVAPVVVQPGPDEPPPTLPDLVTASDPAAYEITPAKALSKGQTASLAADALEAYMFGQRTRWDAAGRLWNMRREAIADLWNLAITVSLGPVVLGEGAIPLDRMPSAEGEHQLIGMVESLAEQVDAKHAELAATQAKQAAGRG